MFFNQLSPTKYFYVELTTFLTHKKMCLKRRIVKLQIDDNFDQLTENKLNMICFIYFKLNVTKLFLEHIHTHDIDIDIRTLIDYQNDTIKIVTFQNIQNTNLIIKIVFLLK